MDTFQYGEIRNDIVTLLQAARNASARSVNALMTGTYWEIGRREKTLCPPGTTSSLVMDLGPIFGVILGIRKLVSA